MCEFYITMDIKMSYAYDVTSHNCAITMNIRIYITMNTEFIIVMSHLILCCETLYHNSCVTLQQTFDVNNYEVKFQISKVTIYSKIPTTTGSVY